MNEPLQIYCVKHPRYRGKIRKSGTRSCDACFFIYILRWQGVPEEQHRIEGPNIYQFIDSRVDELGINLRVRPI
jgi:hypothetical protein